MDKNEKFRAALKFRDQGKYNMALMLLEDLISENVEKENVYLTAGYICELMEDNEKAKFYFEKAIQLNPVSEMASLAVFHINWRDQKYKDALNEINRFMSIGDSEDYREIINELYEKYSRESKEDS